MTSGPPSGIKVRVYVTKDLGNVVTDEENKILYRDVRILYRNSNGVLQVPEEKLKAVSGMQNFVPVFNGGGPKRLYECGNFVWFKIINTEILKSPTHRSLRSLRSKLRGIRRFLTRISGYYLPISLQSNGVLDPASNKW